VVFTLLRRFSTLKFSGVVFIFTLPQSAYFEFMEEGRKSDSQHFVYGYSLAIFLYNTVTVDRKHEAIPKALGQ